MTLRKPNLSHLRVSGSRVIVKEHDKRSGKLSDNCIIGTFLRNTGTVRNTYFYDVKTHQTREVRHIEYDETYFHKASAPSYAQRLKHIVENKLANAEIKKITKTCISLATIPPPSNSTNEPIVEPPAYVSDNESSPPANTMELQIQRI